MTVLGKGADSTTDANINANWVSEGGCLVAGTKILMANKTHKNIEDIQPYEQVLSYDINKRIFVPANVSWTKICKTNKILHITLDNGVILKITPNHPILTTTG